MSYKRVFIPAICIVLAATILVLGCGSSTPSSDNVTTSFTQEIKDYFGEYYNLMKRSDAMSAWSVGMDYEDKGEYDNAIADFTRLIRGRYGLAKSYYYRGCAYRSNGEYENAASDFEKVIELGTSYPELVEDARQALEDIRK